MTSFAPSLLVSPMHQSAHHFCRTHPFPRSHPTSAARGPTSRKRAIHATLTRRPTLESAVRQTSDPENAIIYNDGPFAQFCISLFRRILQPSVGWTSPRKGYTGLVEETRMLLAKQGPNELIEIVMNVLGKLFLAPIGPKIFRQFFADKPRFNAQITPIFFQWLVGRSTINTSENNEQGKGVHIEKCRFLEQSSCKGLCVNMCKIPTQRFFTEELGLPLRMTPNFEDMSCQMSFGLHPLPLHEDPAISGDCLVNCKMSGSYKSLKKLDPCYVTQDPSKERRRKSL